MDFLIIDLFNKKFDSIVHFKKIIFGCVFELWEIFIKLFYKLFESFKFVVFEEWKHFSFKLIHAWFPIGHLFLWFNWKFSIVVLVIFKLFHYFKCISNVSFKIFVSFWKWIVMFLMFRIKIAKLYSGSLSVVFSCCESSFKSFKFIINVLL